MGNPAAVVVWEGPSRLNGEKILVIATGLRSKASSHTNAKTGDLIQLYILPADTDPREAIDSGEDAAVCGSCVHRPTATGEDARRDCYVNVAWAPRNLWLAHRAGNVPPMPRGLLEGAAIRFGAWGDPAAVPVRVWQGLFRGASMHTGYTQLWRDLDVRTWGWLMASVDSEDDQLKASRRGWRTFRTVYDDETPTDLERECLATASHVTCLGCGGCGGTHSAGATRPPYFIRVHGFRHGRPKLVKTEKVEEKRTGWTFPSQLAVLRELDRSGRPLTTRELLVRLGYPDPTRFVFSDARKTLDRLVSVGEVRALGKTKGRSWQLGDAGIARVVREDREV